MTSSIEACFSVPEAISMSDGEFARLREIVLAESGINLSASKKVMLTVRLIKRTRALGMKSFSEYVKFVSSPDGRLRELPFMIDAVSTNKTDFFREAEHFRYLVNVAVPDLLKEDMRRWHEGINFWSAGCASGEEPYTLAMVMSEYREMRPGIKYSILASDISGQTVEKAVRAVYPERVMACIPPEMRRKYLMKGRDRYDGCCRVVPEIRRTVKFMRHNLAEHEFAFGRKMDVVFCRNVVIYLDRAVQERLFSNFREAMSPGGYLFVGHSETLDGITSSFRRVAPTIYRRL